MGAHLLAEYGWTLLVLIALEGILAADNALVMAIIVKHLPETQRKKALFYGLAGAFVFRFTSLFLISFLVNVWELQALGAAYLIFIGLNHFFKNHFTKKQPEIKVHKKPKSSGFWMTVLKVELADIAFAVDSILAAVAIAVTLPHTNLHHIGGMDGGQFLVVFAGGIIGLIIVRFFAGWFVELLNKKPSLENAAYLIVTWVGVKLAITTAAHPSLALISESFPKTTLWKAIFWGVIVLILLLGYFMPHKDDKEALKSADKA